MRTRTLLVTTLGVALCALPSAAAASPVLRVQGSRVVPGDDPYLPPRASYEAGPLPPAPPPAAAAAARGPTVMEVLRRAFDNHRLSKARYERYRKAYRDGASAEQHYAGRCRTQMRGVMRIARFLARTGRLKVSRMEAVFLTIARNVQLWRAKPRVAQGERVEFGARPMVFQHFRGQGIQIHPLGNFGKANWYWRACRGEIPKAGCHRASLGRLLDDMVAVSSKRSSFRAFEYYFYFGGGEPPWASGMAQATGIQALGRAARLLGRKRYIGYGREALGLFDKRPGVGVRVSYAGGAHYLLYSFAPGQRVLNAFLQTIIGLYDFAHISHDRHSAQLFRDGDRAARKEAPRYDTGRWSRYSLGGPDASYSYHLLATEFLERLCQRTHAPVYCRLARRFRAYLRKRGKPPAGGKPVRQVCGFA